MAKRGIDAFFSASSPSSSAKKPKLDETNGPDKQDVPYDSHKSYPIPLPSRFPFDVTVNDRHRLIADKPELDLVYHQPLFPGATAHNLFRFLRDEFPWYRVTYQVRGMTINTPRYTTVFGLDETHAFPAHPQSDSGSSSIIDCATGRPMTKPFKCSPRPLPGCLHALRALVEAQCGEGTRFNFCLLNYYKDGDDSISYHSDDESFLGPLPLIASISLGAPRDFHMRLKADHKVTWKTCLQPGDMVVMRGSTQAKWDHGVPKRKGKDIGPRINITFRKAVVRYGTENYYRYNVHDGPYFRWDAQQNSMVLGSTFNPDSTRSTRTTTTTTKTIRKQTPGASVAELKQEESFDVEEAVAAIEAAAAKTVAGTSTHAPDLATTKDQDSLDLEAQIKAIDEAVARAQQNSETPKHQIPEY